MRTLPDRPPIKILKTLPNLEQWYKANTPPVKIFRTLPNLEPWYKAIL